MRRRSEPQPRPTGRTQQQPSAVARTPPPRLARAAVAVPKAPTPTLSISDAAVEVMREIVRRDAQRVEQRGSSSMHWLQSCDASGAQTGLCERRDDVKSFSSSGALFIRSQSTALPTSVSTLNAIDVEAERRGLLRDDVDRFALGVTQCADTDDGLAFRRSEQLFPSKGATFVTLPAITQAVRSRRPSLGTDGAGAGAGESTDAPRSTPPPPQRRPPATVLPPVTAAYARLVGSMSSVAPQPKRPFDDEAPDDGDIAQPDVRRHRSERFKSIALVGPNEEIVARVSRTVKFSPIEEVEQQVAFARSNRDAMSPAAFKTALRRRGTVVQLDQKDTEGLFVSETAKAQAEPELKDRSFVLPDSMRRFAHIPNDEDHTSALRALRRRLLRKLARRAALRQQVRDLRAQASSAFVADQGAPDDDDPDDGIGSVAANDNVKIYSVHVKLAEFITTNGKKVAPSITIDDVFALLGTTYNRKMLIVTVEAKGPTDRFIDFKNHRLVKPVVAARACLTFLHAANMPVMPNASSLLIDGRADHDSPASGSPTTASPRTDYDLSVMAAVGLESVEGSIILPLQSSSFGAASPTVAGTPWHSRDAAAVRRSIAWAVQTQGHDIVEVPQTEEYPRAYDRLRCYDLEECRASFEIDSKDAKKARARQKQMRERMAAGVFVAEEQSRKATPAGLASLKSPALRVVVGGTLTPNFSHTPTAATFSSFVAPTLLPQSSVPVAVDQSTASNTAAPRTGGMGLLVLDGRGNTPKLSERISGALPAAPPTDDAQLSDSDDEREVRRAEGKQHAPAESDNHLFASPNLTAQATKSNFQFKHKKTFATHSAAAQLREAEERAAREEAEDDRQLRQDVTLPGGVAGVGKFDTSSDDDEEEEEDADGSGSSEESGGSEAGMIDNVALTPADRVELLFHKYRVDPRPEPMLDFAPTDPRDYATLKCALCIYSRPQMFCCACGFLMCKQCCSFVHKDDTSGGASNADDSDNDSTNAANDQAEADAAPSTADDDGISLEAVKEVHRPLLLSKYAKQVAKERYEKALQEEREAQAQRELEEQLSREEAMRRNQSRAYELMMENGGLVAGSRTRSAMFGSEEYDNVATRVQNNNPHFNAEEASATSSHRRDRKSARSTTTVQSVSSAVSGSSHGSVVGRSSTRRSSTEDTTATTVSASDSQVFESAAGGGNDLGRLEKVVNSSFLGQRGLQRHDAAIIFKRLKKKKKSEVNEDAANSGQDTGTPTPGEASAVSFAVSSDAADLSRDDMIAGSAPRSPARSTCRHHRQWCRLRKASMSARSRPQGNRSACSRHC
jgi:hypothetical protein